MEYLRPNEALKMRQLLQHFPALVLSGARQTGKTTLLRMQLPDYNYVTLDLPSVAEQAEKDPAQFLREHPAPLIIDEVQYAPGIFRHLKSVIDADRHTMGRYVLTGSQKFTLMKGVAESLAGRLAVMELENLNYDEIEHHDGHASGLTLIQVLVRGQFPELYRNRQLNSGDFYSSYLATYLERDVRQILNVTSLRDFERFMRTLAARNGQILNKSEIAKDVGVSIKAIGDWVSVLETSNQIVLLEPWFQNFSKRIVKSPKIFFCDTGLLCFLLGVSEESFSHSPFAGTLFEAFCFAEMRKLNRYRKNPARFWYYRDQRAREIDFILESNGKLSFIECKFRELVQAKDTAAMRAIRLELENSKSPYRPSERNYVLANVPGEYPMDKIFSAVRPLGIGGILPK